MKAPDSFLIDNVFEPLSHWTQKMIGATNFTLAKLMVVLEIVGELVGIYTLMYIFNFTLGVYSWLVISTACGAYRSRTMLNTIREEEESDRLRPATQKRRHDEKFLHRMAGITFCVLLFVKLINVIMLTPVTGIIVSISGFMVALFGFTCKEYFLACTPLPPGESKFQQWMRETSKTRREAQSAAYSPTST